MFFRSLPIANKSPICFCDIFDSVTVVSLPLSPSPRVAAVVVFLDNVSFAVVALHPPPVTCWLCISNGIVVKMPHGALVASNRAERSHTTGSTEPNGSA